MPVRVRSSCDSVASGQLRDAEIEQLHGRLAARDRDEEHVVGLEVAMDDARFVRGLERRRDRPRRSRAPRSTAAAGCIRARSDSPCSHSITKKRRPSSSWPKSKMSTMFGCPIWLTARASCTNRSIAFGFARELAADHLDRGALADQRMARAVDRAHAAFADLLLDPVVARERARRELFVRRALQRERTITRGRVGHGGRSFARECGPIVRTHPILCRPPFAARRARRHRLQPV